MIIRNCYICDDHRVITIYDSQALRGTGNSFISRMGQGKAYTFGTSLRKSCGC